ncbi:MAG: YitT family protein [Muribaculaceae bacterium]|nr:YitT family protein [Muribaculaceae bacterium]
MGIETSKLWRVGRDYFFITFGMALYAFGFCGFILPEKVVIGGLAGIGTIIYFLTGIPVAISQYALNLVLLAIAYKVVGKQFVLGTIYGATMISVFVGIFQPLLANGFTHDPFMNVVIGGACAGMGVGIAFTHNGSSGGTDIVAAMVSKYTNVTIGRMMLYSDCIIISSSFLIFHQPDKVVYGFVVLVLASYMADMVINTNRQAVQFTIFSKKWEEIATAINNEAHRGCTVLTGMGWYSKQEVKVLMVMCRKIESVTISRIIKSIDPDAFTTQANVNGVYGKGFDELKVKMKAPDHSLISRQPASKVTEGITTNIPPKI